MQVHFTYMNGALGRFSDPHLSNVDATKNWVYKHFHKIFGIYQYKRGHARAGGHVNVRRAEQQNHQLWLICYSTTQTKADLVQLLF